MSRAGSRLVLISLAGALLLAVAALAAQSPLFRVRTVSWTGSVVLPELRCQALERAALGRPLYLVSERALRDALALDGIEVDLELRRHPPSTLEARIAPRRAVARLDARTAIDARGRRLPPEHVVPGLPLLSGFALDPAGERLEPQARRLLATLRPLFDCPALAPAEVRLAGDELQLVLADSGTQVRLDVATAAEAILKLRIFEESLGGEPLPGCIDLRFDDQVVVREGGIRSASRRAR